MPKLTYTLDGQEHTVEVGDSCSIGRAETNDIALASEAGASRRHAQIMKLSRSYELTDLGSTNGTKVGGKKVQRHRLADGDVIQIGDTHLRWSDGSGGDVEIEEEISLDDDAAPTAARGGGGGSGGASYLVFAGGARDGERIALDAQRTTFGRRSSNTVTVESAAVSGYHCEITREGGSYVLRDLGSTNGTMLDGEPVSEIALQHGGRIRIGDQLLVFVDPSISDFEKAMAAVDDLGTEWGMLRAEMDMTRVQRARRSQVVAVVGVVAVIGVIGYVVLANPELLSEQTVALEETEGNAVPDFSFEEARGDWTVAPGSPTRTEFGTGDAAQGSAYFTVSRDGPAGAPAIAELTGKEFTIRPGTTYRFGAKVRTRGAARAALSGLWSGAGEGALGARESTTGPVSAGSWTEISASAQPPANTTRARLRLVNTAEGNADFDDVLFVPGGAAAGGAHAADGDISVTATSEGALTIARGGDVLLDDLRVVGGAFGGAMDRGELPVRTGTAAVSSVAAEGGAVRVAGDVLDPYTGESAAFDLTFTPSEGRAVTIAGSLPPTAGIVGLVPEDVLDKGVGVWTAAGSFRESQTRFVPAAERVSVGSAKRYEVSSTNGAARFALLFDGGVHAAAFGSREGTLALRLDAATQELDAKRDALRDAARLAESQGRAGEAAQLYEDYASEFPEGSAQQDDARSRSARLRAAGVARLEALRRLADGAVKYGDLDALAAAAIEAADVADSFGLVEAGEIAERVEKAAAERRAALAEARAEPVLGKAMDHLSGGRKTLAQALLRDVVERFPGTEAAAGAKSALDGIGK